MARWKVIDAWPPSGPEFPRVRDEAGREGWVRRTPGTGKLTGPVSAWGKDWPYLAEVVDNDPVFLEEPPPDALDAAGQRFLSHDPAATQMQRLATEGPKPDNETKRGL